MKPVVLFYHLFATNDWRDISDEQFSSLLKSGLPHKAILHVCISGAEKADATEWFHQFSPHFRSYQCHCIEENQYEWSTLKLLWDMAKGDDAYYMYFHAKGVTQSGEKRTHINFWRQYLDYFCITRWKDCIGCLEYGADLAGCQYMVPTRYYPGHYSGNFWWASTEYVHRLPNPESYFHERLEAEFWSCRASHKAANLWSTDLCMYQRSILPESYQYKPFDPVVYVNELS